MRYARMLYDLRQRRDEKVSLHADESHSPCPSRKYLENRNVECGIGKL